MEENTHNKKNIVIVAILAIALILGIGFFVSKKSQQINEEIPPKNEATPTPLTQAEIMKSFTAPAATTTKTTDPKVLKTYSAPQNSQPKEINQATLNSFSVPSQ